MNPPFVRHHLVSKNDLEEYRKQTNNICRVKKTSDLWTYFLLKSADLLKKGGSIGAILPWSFLQSDYSLEVRNWLTRKFDNIRLLALTDEYFEEMRKANENTKKIPATISKEAKIRHNVDNTPNTRGLYCLITISMYFLFSLSVSVDSVFSSIDVIFSVISLKFFSLLT